MVIRLLGQFVMFYLLVITISCQQVQSVQQDSDQKDHITDMQIVRLGQGDQEKFENIKNDFIERNPGYSIEYLKGVESVKATSDHRVLFVQEGQPNVQLSNGLLSEITVGDIIVLEPGVSIEADSAVSLLEFVVPNPVSENIPRIIRPDWDPNITDIPGGCATETNAYRRILLTWKQEVGDYLYHALNAHRVRIMDSFSHYHPVDGGFDEFYLVQMALPEAKIITSNQVEVMVNPEEVSYDVATGMLRSTNLKVGDLVYLPRGVMHRGIGGVLAHVITVPGFIPGSEIGVDHHLKAINERLNLAESEALPYHADAANAPLIK